MSIQKEFSHYLVASRISFSPFEIERKREVIWGVTGVSKQATAVQHLERCNSDNKTGYNIKIIGGGVQKFPPVMTTYEDVHFNRDRWMRIPVMWVVNLKKWNWLWWRKLVRGTKHEWGNLRQLIWSEKWIRIQCTAGYSTVQIQRLNLRRYSVLII